MNQPIEITFDYPLASSDITIAVRAVATLHHSDPYYVVDHFQLMNRKPKKNEPSIMPAQEIRQITRRNARVWVHRDSERESLLSLAMGKAIEEVMKQKKG